MVIQKKKGIDDLLVSGEKPKRLTLKEKQRKKKSAA
jgi:hypothetical protein